MSLHHELKICHKAVGDEGRYNRIFFEATGTISLIKRLPHAIIFET